MTVADETDTSIQVTCWGETILAHLKTVQVGTLLVLAQCRVSDYCGRSINASSEVRDMLVCNESKDLFIDRLKVIK